MKRDQHKCGKHLCLIKDDSLYVYFFSHVSISDFTVKLKLSYESPSKGQPRALTENPPKQKTEPAVYKNSPSIFFFPSIFDQ